MCSKQRIETIQLLLKFQFVKLCIFRNFKTSQLDQHWDAAHCSCFIQQDSERAEAESGIAQTTTGIYVIRVEAAGPEDEMYADVGVVLEGVEVLQNLQSITFASLMVFVSLMC